jgi:hypothetical protein
LRQKKQTSDTGADGSGVSPRLAPNRLDGIPAGSAVIVRDSRMDFRKLFFYKQQQFLDR